MNMNCMSAMALAATLLFASTVSAATAARTAAPAEPLQASPEASFNRWDKDTNKVLSMEEFKAGWQEVQVAAVLRKLRENFNTMDANKSDSLEAAEFANLELVKRAGKSAPAMSAFDADKNAQLNFKEYVAMVSAIRGNQR